MTPGKIEELRREYHRRICTEVLHKSETGVPNNADRASAASVEIGKGIVDHIGIDVQTGSLPGQTAGRRFENATMNFLRNAFKLLHHLRPGKWEFSVGGKIREYEQYQHLSDVSRAIKENEALRTVFGDYIVTPDIVVGRKPDKDETINQNDILLSGDEIAAYTPLRWANSRLDILHASISCKWTIRSDRSQNARTEGLNLIRNRKGKTPHIAVVTGEPLPGRIASLAYGIGDIDCVYHFALRELIEATKDNASGSDSEDTLNTLVSGKRLRDISDLPFDLAI